MQLHSLAVMFIFESLDGLLHTWWSVYCVVIVIGGANLIAWNVVCASDGKHEAWITGISGVQDLCISHKSTVITHWILHGVLSLEWGWSDPVSTPQITHLQISKILIISDWLNKVISPHNTCLCFGNQCPLSLKINCVQVLKFSFTLMCFTWANMIGRIFVHGS